jgi:hypothetical protein
MKNRLVGTVLCVFLQSLGMASGATPTFSGPWVEGEGDVRTLELINAAFESSQPSARMACLPLLYKRDWDGFVEGPPWPCWWIQNSFGPSYALMPFLGEPYATWLEHSQALWFRLMGDGQRKDVNGFQGPDGCLCDAAFVMLNGGSQFGFGDFRKAGGGVGQTPDGKIHQEGIWYRQGDGNPKQHDWFIGATAGGLILESERLLVRHDVEAARKRLAELERVAAFLDTRRDPESNLLKGGMAANLLAPSYSGIRQPDGTFGQAYLTELSVNYVAGLERLAEVCVLCDEPAKARRYRETAGKVRQALPRLMAPDGCFMMSEDPDGVRHGVFGAAQHGYFEATPNHDAGCFRVTDDASNEKIIRRMLALKGDRAPGGLAPHGLIIPNYPGYDDSVHGGPYGHWVNGGHWTTTQGRMNIACLRANEFAHPFGAWAKIRALMEGYRADAPLTGFGATPWGDKLQAPYCVVYDCWGASGGLLRGLFEYDYRADRLLVRPHLPANITRYVQKFPVWFGKTRIYLTVTGSGTIDWTELRPTGKSEALAVELVRGDARRQGAWQPKADAPLTILDDPSLWELSAWPAPTSGNCNPLRIGASPGGGYNFSGEFREVRIYRRPLTEAEIAALAKGGVVDGALISEPPATGAPSHLVARNAGTFLEYPPSADVDFRENFTLSASIRPFALADSARLIDRATVGTMDGYLLDYLQGGKILRLLTPWGIAQGPVNLETGKWQHVAATCAQDGLMRVYLDGAKVAEAQGQRPAPIALAEGQQVDLKKLAAFYRAMVKAGRQDAYETAEARTALELLVARHERMRKPLPPPDLGAIPSCNREAVDALYFNTARWIAGGLVDRLAGRSVWQERVPPEIQKIARQEGIIP